MKNLRWPLLCLLLLALSGCSTLSAVFTKAPKYNFPGKSASDIFAIGEDAMGKGNYTYAVKAYEHLESTYPFGSLAEQTQLNLIYAYYMDNNPIAAKAAAERFIHLYPRSKNVDYAYYMRGLSSFAEERSVPQKYLPIDLSARDLKDSHQAYNEFNELITRFPNSKYIADARQRMIYLRNLFALHEINIAEFYLRHHTYVAAANRATYVVKHYQQSPQVANALLIMVKSYRALQQPALADKALKTLALNFPDSKQLKEARGEKVKKSRTWYQIIWGDY